MYMYSETVIHWNLLILLDELWICTGSLTHVRSLPACRQWEVGGSAGTEAIPINQLHQRSELIMLSIERRGSVVVSMPAYHAADRGSNHARTRRDY